MCDEWLTFIDQQESIIHCSKRKVLAKIALTAASCCIYTVNLTVCTVWLTLAQSSFKKPQKS